MGADAGLPARRSRGKWVGARAVPAETRVHSSQLAEPPLGSDIARELRLPSTNVGIPVSA